MKYTRNTIHDKYTIYLEWEPITGADGVNEIHEKYMPNTHEIHEKYIVQTYYRHNTDIKHTQADNTADIHIST